MLSQLFSLYGDVIPLKFTPIEENISELLSPFENDWKHYNPKKPDIKRYGLSITSLDGLLTGLPDLDSIKEYNAIHGLRLGEESFDKKTIVHESSKSLINLTSSFENVGRSHFIKFGIGGFFPYHRDGNFRLPAKSFRVFSLAQGHNKADFIWLMENKRLEIIERKWYVINTFKEHCVFSFTDKTIITVLNIPVSTGNINSIIDNMDIS
ncbi:hypothetical protein H7Y21_00060 [Arenimonas sp.]|nr:hypothetical protein [Candidatus Parcubacteria bacterium]